MSIGEHRLNSATLSIEDCLHAALPFAGRLAQQRCVPLLQRACRSPAAAAALVHPRGVASLHSPVASCSYHPARAAPCRSALPRSSWAAPASSASSSSSSDGSFQSGGLLRFSAALTGGGSSLLGGHAGRLSLPQDDLFSWQHPAR